MREWMMRARTRQGAAWLPLAGSRTMAYPPTSAGENIQHWQDEGMGSRVF